MKSGIINRGISESIISYINSYFLPSDLNANVGSILLMAITTAFIIAFINLMLLFNRPNISSLYSVSDILLISSGLNIIFLEMCPVIESLIRAITFSELKVANIF